MQRLTLVYDVYVKREREREREREVNFPISAGWTSNKQFCFSKSAPFRIL